MGLLVAYTYCSNAKLLRFIIDIIYGIKFDKASAYGRNNLRLTKMLFDGTGSQRNDLGTISLFVNSISIRQLFQ